MSTIAAHALAPTFTHTASAADFSLTFSAGVSPVTGTLLSGSYRMWLTPLASCYLRQLASRMKAAIVAARGAGGTVVATLAADGIVTFTFGVDIPATITLAAPMWRALGFASATPTVTPNGTIVGVRPVWYLALITAATGPWWQPKQPGGSEEDNGGNVYTFASSITSWQRSLKVDFQPTTPTFRASLGCDATGHNPDETYVGALGSTATAREWSVLDVLYASRNALCGYTGSWQTLRTSTTDALWRVRVRPTMLLSTPSELLKPEWTAYTRWTLDLVAPSTTPTETRG